MSVTKSITEPAEGFLVDAGGRALRAFRYRGGTKGNLIMIPDWAGATTAAAHLLAQQYAQFCQVEVVLTDLYGAEFSAFDYGLVDPIIQETMANPRPMRVQLLALIEALASEWEQPDVPLIAVGFCFGGSLVFEAARAGAPLDAVISAHGMPVSADPLSARRRGTGGEFIMCQGASDPFITEQHLHLFEQEMQSTGQTWSLVKFGHAKHPFTRADIGAGNAAMGYNSRADWDTRATCRNTFERLAAHRQ